LAAVETDFPSPEAVEALLEGTLSAFVREPSGPVEKPPADVKAHLDKLLEAPSTMRDGILILLAYAVAHGEPIDFRSHAKFPSGRRVSQFVADKLLPGLKIAGRKDSLQTGVKGVSTYYDRENETWKAVLGWASDQQSVEPVEAAWRYLAAGMAKTARDLPPMPDLDTPRLTFARVFTVLDALLSQPSGGSVEQFAFAALLEAYLLQRGEGGVVETKNINAADAPGGTAADVQHKHLGQVAEAYEVTAGDWRSKLGQAEETLRSRDLRRVHILGTNVIAGGPGSLTGELPGNADISVLDVREEIRSLAARLDKFHRRHALERLYDHLVEKQPRDNLVREYVAELGKQGLVGG
jgi:hypothetical protein